MPLQHEQRPSCAINHVNVTKSTDGKFYCSLNFVRITTKSCSVAKIDAFTKFNIKLVLLNRFP